MDIYQIMARLDAISSKKTLTESQEMAAPISEGRFKELDIILQDYPEAVEEFKQTGELSTELYRALFDFYEDQMDYGTAKARTGDPYEFISQKLSDALGLDETHEKLPVDQLGLDKFSQAALSGGQRKRDALANPERARMLAKKSAQNKGVAEASPPGGFKPGDRVTVQGQKGPGGTTTGVFVQQLPTQAGQKPMYAFRFDGKQYPGNTYDMVSANNIFPAGVDSKLLKGKGGLKEGDLNEINTSQEVRAQELGRKDATNKLPKNPFAKQLDRRARKAYDSGYDSVKKSVKQGVEEAHPDVMRHAGDKTVRVVKKAGKPIGEIGIDAEASPGNGQYYVKLYNGSYDAVGFDTAEEALAELKAAVKQGVAEAAVGEGNEFSGELAKAKATGAKEFEVDGKRYPVKESKGSKPDFLDMDKDGDKKEPMKKAAKDKNDAKGSFQKQMGGSAKELTKGLSIKEAEVDEGIGKKIAHGIGKAVKKVAPNWVEKQVKADDERQAKAKKAAVDKFTSIAQKDTKKVDEDRTEEKDKDGKVVRWKEEGEWKKASGKDPRGKVTNMSDKARKETGKISKQKVDEVFPGTTEYELRFGKPDSASAFDKKKISTGTVYSRRYKDEPEADDSDTPKKKGRPAGSKRALGAKGPGVNSKLLKGKGGLKEQDIDPADRGEYDREGDMAKNQVHQIADAVKELHSILDSDDNLPEWVQSKITKALDYIDTARDYLDAEQGHDRETVKEKAVSKKQQKFMGMVYAAQKGEKPASKEVAKVAKDMGKKDAKDFAATKHKGLPEKKKKEVEETTVAGSVATGGDAPKKAKGGMEFGKGVYEGALAESFDKKLETMLNEGTNLTISTDDQGQKSVSVSATGADADQLSDMLKMAGLFSSEGYSRACQHCGGIHEAGACGAEQVDEELANSPDEKYADADTMVNTLSGGLNGPKLQANPNNMGDNPLAMRQLGKTSSPSLNLGDVAESVEKEAAGRLWDLYKKIDN